MSELHHIYKYLARNDASKLIVAHHPPSIALNEPEGAILKRKKKDNNGQPILEYINSVHFINW